MLWQLHRSEGPDELVWYVHNTAANFSNVDLSLGWNHVVLTHTDGSTPTLYLNGTSYTGSQTITWNSDTSAVLRIGRTEVASESFNGTIDEVRIADTIHTACYIKAQYNNQIWPDASVTPSPDPTPNPSCGFYNPGIETTEVDLASFSAHGVDGAVELEWETATELDNIGFQLYRSESEAGPFERITPSAIPGLGSSVVGASYAYRDTNVTNGTSYYYELEDIETTGRTERHGPVRATPRAGETSLRDEPDDGEPPPSDSEEALITYGEPSSSTWRVTPRGRDQILIELDTRGFYALPQEDGSVRLSIPGFVELGEADGPALPVKRQWVEAIAGRKVELVSVMARDVEAFTSLRPSQAAIPELVASRDGTVRAMNRRARTAFRGEGLSPSSAARLLEVGFQGEVKKALVELAPLRWDAARGQLLLARRLVVRVSFRTPDPSEEATRGRRGRRYRRRRSHDERSVAKRLVTVEPGLYAVRYEDVMSGSRSVSARSLRLSRQGKAVAFHLEPNRPRFQPGSTLYFMSGGASVNPYGNEAVYELEVGRTGARMQSRSAAPSGDPTTFYMKRVEQEQNRYYQAALTEKAAPDLWLWDLLFAPVTKSYPFEVSALASTTERSSLTVWLQGISDFEADPDHHVRVYVNGSLVGESSWDRQNVAGVSKSSCCRVRSSKERTRSRSRTWATQVLRTRWSCSTASR